eukprot:8938562-Pyramimonas_sp.AAC.1
MERQRCWHSRPFASDGFPRPQDGSTIAQKWPKRSPRWPQDDPQSTPRGPQEAPLGTPPSLIDILQDDAKK